MKQTKIKKLSTPFSRLCVLLSEIFKNMLLIDSIIIMYNLNNRRYYDCEKCVVNKQF